MKQRDPKKNKRKMVIKSLRNIFILKEAENIVENDDLNLLKNNVIGDLSKLGVSLF